MSPIEFSRLHERITLDLANYHFTEPASLGVVRVTATRPKRGATEHLFRPAERGEEL